MKKYFVFEKLGHWETFRCPFEFNKKALNAGQERLNPLKNIVGKINFSLFSRWVSILRSSVLKAFSI